MRLAISKLYGNDELHLPKIIIIANKFENDYVVSLDKFFNEFEEIDLLGLN